MPKLQWSESAILSAGTYPVLIRDVTEVDGQYGKQLQLQFVVVDNENNPGDDEIRGYCMAKWGPKTKLFNWAKNILGKKAPPLGADFDTDSLKGKFCDIMVEDEPQAGGTTKSKVTQIFPFRSVSSKADF